VKIINAIGNQEVINAGFTKVSNKAAIKLIPEYFSSVVLNNPFAKSQISLFCITLCVLYP
jgi:hypothetical protein